MRNAAGAGIGVRQLIGALVYVVRELRERVDRDAGIDGPYFRVGADHADRSIIPERIVGRLADERRNRDLRRRAQAERIAVGCGAPRPLGRQPPGRAWPTSHDEGLAKNLAQSLRNDASNETRVPARRERHQDAYRALRPILRLCRPDCAQERTRAYGPEE